MGGGQTFLHTWGDNNDVDGKMEEDVSEANILANKASKLSKGARVVTDPYGPEFWPRYQIPRFS